MSLRSLAVCGAIFAAAFVATCAILGRYLPFPEVKWVRAKLEHLARHGDQYDVLFIGSSRVSLHIIPSEFDAVAAAHGVPVKSFNAGIPAMYSPEEDYVLEQILCRPHRHLRWVIVELDALHSEVSGERTARFAYWHDAVRLEFVARSVLERADRLFAQVPAANLSPRCEIWSSTGGRLWAHLSGWMVRASSLSRGSEMLGRWLRLPDADTNPRRILGDAGDGWVPVKSVLQQMAPEVRAIYEKGHAERLVTPAARHRGDKASQLSLERTLAAVTQAGARPILLVPPTTTGQLFYPREDWEKDLTILDYSNVRKYPELFVAEHRTDGEHLNTEGAKIFSEIIAREFAEWVKNVPPPP